MITTIALVHDAAGASDARVRAVASFLASEGEGLHDILQIFGEDEAADALRAVASRCSGSDPDPQSIASALRVALGALEEIPNQVVEHAARAGRGPRDLHAAVLWYNARLADLAHRFET